MENIDTSRLDGQVEFADLALSSPARVEINAAFCVVNPFDNTGHSLALLESVKGETWRMAADKSWSNIQGGRELTALLVVPITDNEAKIDEKWSGDFQTEVSKGIVVRFTNWFIVGSLPDGRHIIEAELNGVKSEHKSFAQLLNDLIAYRYEVEAGV